MASRYSLGWRTVRDVFEMTGGKCYYCGCDLPEDTHEFDDRGNVVSSSRNWDIDHYIPISKGGSHKMGNLVPSCKVCNNAKRDKTGDEFMAAGAR